jgi:hypothetical protein
MMYKADAAACSEICTKHSKPADHRVELLSVKPGGAPVTALTNLQHHPNQFETWLNNGALKPMKINRHVTFSLKRETCLAVTLNGQHIPQEETAKYRRSTPRPPADMAKTRLLKENSLV